MDELIKQVQLLKETMEAMIQRQEQLFKLQEEKSQALLETAQKLQATIDSLSITDEALKQSLNEVDSQVDDLAQITAALLSIQQQQGNQAQQ